EVPASDVQTYLLPRDTVGWMDGGGSNLVRFNEQLPGHLKAVVTTHFPDGEKNKARQRADEFGVPFFDFDFQGKEEEVGIHPGDYYRALRWQEITKEIQQASGTQRQILLEEEAKLEARLRKSTDLPKLQIITTRYELTEQFVDEVTQFLQDKGIDPRTPWFAAGGEVLMGPAFFKDDRMVVNIHPGLLQVCEAMPGYKRGRRLLVGDAWRASAKALTMRLPEMYATMHRMTYKMDAGPIIMKSYPFPVDYNRLESKVDLSDKKVLEAVASEVQERLKWVGDHVVSGATLLDMYEGNWGVHKDTGTLAYNFRGKWYLAPVGVSIDDHVENHHGKTPFVRDEGFRQLEMVKFDEAVDKIAAEYADCY
ncbi:MAG: hypothetical protein ABIE94_02765, partial [archaeon]